MSYLTAFGRVTHDGLAVSYLGLVVTATGAEGTWLVHRRGQRPVEGVAVWKYPYGLRCERDGPGPCIHLDTVRRYELAEGGRLNGNSR